MKPMRSATVGFAALGLVFVGCATTSPSMEVGSTLYRDGQYVSAADAFTDAIEANPNSVAAWNNRAAALLHAGELNRALADYNRALELAPDDPDLYYNRGNALTAAGRYPEAINDYTRTLQLNPNYSKAAFNRGTAYALLGQRDVAQTDWTRAIALEPDPWTKGAMRRAAGLDGAPVVTIAAPTVRQPVVTMAPPPSAPQPAASVPMLDARAYAARAVTRELDGDHAGAMQDLRTAMSLEPDAARRAAIANLMRRLDTPR